MADNQQIGPDRDELIQQFIAMCNTSAEQATQYLTVNQWELPAACNSYFQDEDEAKLESKLEANKQEAEYTGPRTLDGRPAPQTESGSSSRSKAKPSSQQKKKGIATLGSLGAGSGHQHDDDGDDDDEWDEADDDDGRGNLFAGGEKSGLAVQDPKQEGGPRKIISDILAKAKANASRPGATASDVPGPSGPSRFRGSGVTLGGEGVESRAIPDPNGATSSSNTENTPPQERVLHIWQDGFSIDDGELRRYDDPANQTDLQMIRSGRAPLHLMNVQHDQPVDVKLHQHDTPYKPQPKKYKPFSGAGQRLGSPVPGTTSSSSAAPTLTTTTPSTPAAGQAPALDSSQPIISIRIQLPDGTRLPARFNTSNTIGDIHNFILSSSAETRSRSWVLSTTFPNKQHADLNLKLGDIAELKKGGVVVVQWI